MYRISIWTSSMENPRVRQCNSYMEALLICKDYRGYALICISIFDANEPIHKRRFPKMDW
jgi:hypothetical protein